MAHPADPIFDSSSDSQSPSRLRNLWYALAIFAATAVAYTPAYRADFIWDDPEYVLNNPNLRTADGLTRTWTDTKSNPQYYPLVFTTFWLEHHLWGLHPAGYHAVNVALHALNAICLFVLLKRLNVPGAWLCGLLFAIHPVHVESVAWVTERKNVLSAFFYLLSALCYLNFAGIGPQAANDPTRESVSAKNLAWYVCSLLLFIAALLSKSVTCSFPAAMMLVLWMKHRLSPRQCVALVPFFTLGLYFGLQTANLEKDHVLAIGPEWDLSFVQRSIIAGRAVVFYLQKLVVPFGLSFNYYRWEPSSLANWQLIIPVAGLIGLIALGLSSRQIGRGPFVAACFFVGTLFPALGFFNIYPMRYSFVADHFQYLASIGPISFIAAFLATRMKALPNGPNAIPGILRATSAFVVLLFLMLTFLQARVYQNLETLWQDTIAKNPDSFLAHHNLADLYMSQRRVQDALRHYERAVALKSDDYRTHFGLAQSLEKTGDWTRAQRHYDQSIELDETKPNVRHRYGEFLLSLGRLDQAQSQFEAAIRLDPKQEEPSHVNALIILGNIAFESKRIADAEHYYLAALSLDPNSQLARSNLEKLRFQRSNNSTPPQPTRP